MSKQKLVPLDKETNDKLDDLVEYKQQDSFNRVTKKGVVAELIAKEFKREFK